MVNVNKRKRNKIIFYCVLLAFPVLQFFVFYCCVNFNGILLSFKSYEEGSYEYVGFANYVTFYKNVFVFKDLRYPIVNSLKVSFMDFVIIMPLTLLFSFYIAKEYRFGKFFRVMLFMPTIISSIVIILLYKYIMEDVRPEIVKAIWGRESETFIQGDDSRRWLIVTIYYIWVSFGSSIILYSGAMSGISADMIEAAHLDGADGIREFWHISIPGVWSTIVVLTLAKLTGFFTNKYNLFSFYETKAGNLSTIGYYMFKETYSSIGSMETYPLVSAMGVIFTIVIAPVTFALKHVMEKYGPSED